MIFFFLCVLCLFARGARFFIGRPSTETLAAIGTALQAKAPTNAR